MWLDPITVRIERRAQVVIFALGAISLPECLVSSTLIRRNEFVAAYRLCGGYSNLEPLLPIPNRTVKRVCADDSVHSHAKVGHRQTIQAKARSLRGSGFFVGGGDAELALNESERLEKAA